MRAMTTPPPPLPRRLAAELVGTALLATVVVGSGLRAVALSPDEGVRLLANAGASALALVVLIELFGPVSGGHLNPLVSAAAWWDGPRSLAALRELAAYVCAQALGAVAGTVLADVMFGHPALRLPDRPRAGAALWLSEAVASAALLLVVCGLLRSGRARLVPAAVGLWIGAACWATSSGSAANPAVTLGRALTDSWTGLAAGSLPGFVLAQCVGAAAGLALVALLFGPGRGGARPTAEDAPEAVPEASAGASGAASAGPRDATGPQDAREPALP